MTKEPLSEEVEDFRRLRDYICKCPNISKKSHAIQVALSAIDLELKRIERDAKLKRKFQTNVNNDQSVKVENEAFHENLEISETTSMLSYKGKLRNTPKSEIDATDEDKEMHDEWQDLAQQSESILGDTLAKQSITSIAQYQISVHSPLSALFLAFHASLVSSTLGFVCTGIPENPSTRKGFAAPIRELPTGQFIPPKWQDVSSHLCEELKLRYRKASIGSVILTARTIVSKEQPQQLVHVWLTPSTTDEPLTPPLVVSIADHINLDSFHKALTKEGGSVYPALHYKALSTLLTNFVQAIDVGTIEESSISDNPTRKLPYVDATIPQADPISRECPLQLGKSGLDHHPTWMQVSPDYNPHDMPTIQIFQPHRPHLGDFSGDHHPFGDASGNLLGPNHPMFGIGDKRVFGMRPRYDPIGPPGGPQEGHPMDPNSQWRRGRGRLPGGHGEPNPDHLPPPTTFNNMFL
jgi:hypothetical protein